MWFRSFATSSSMQCSHPAESWFQLRLLLNFSTSFFFGRLFINSCQFPIWFVASIKYKSLFSIELALLFFCFAEIMIHPTLSNAILIAFHSFSDRDLSRKQHFKWKWCHGAEKHTEMGFIMGFDWIMLYVNAVICTDFKRIRIGDRGHRVSCEIGHKMWWKFVSV